MNQFQNSAGTKLILFFLYIKWCNGIRGEENPSPHGIDPSLTLIELFGDSELLVALQRGLRRGHGHEAGGCARGHYGGHIRV